MGFVESIESGEIEHSLFSVGCATGGNRGRLYYLTVHARFLSSGLGAKQQAHRLCFVPLCTLASF